MKNHLLIIEDHRPRADALSVAARERDLEVTACEKGQDFLHLADTLLPSAIVLSSELAKPSGWAVVNRLKTHKVLRRVPLLLLVGGEDPAGVAEQHARLRSRADDYLPLQTGPGLILDRLQAILPPDRQAYLESLFLLREQTPSPGGFVWLLALIIAVAVAAGVFWFIR